MRCAHAVRRVGYFGPVSPDGQSDRSHYSVPTRRTAQILTQSKNSDDESKQTMFCTANAGSLSQSAVLPRGRMLPRRWGVFRAVTGTLTYPPPPLQPPPPGVGGGDGHLAQKVQPTPSSTVSQNTLALRLQNRAISFVNGPSPSGKNALPVGSCLGSVPFHVRLRSNTVLSDPMVVFGTWPMRVRGEGRG